MAFNTVAPTDGSAPTGRDSRKNLQGLMKGRIIIAAVYVLMVPSFAAVYTYLLPPKSFKHTNTQYEPQFEDEKKRFTHDLLDEIRGKFVSAHENSFDFGTWQIDPASFDLLDLEIGNRQISFRVDLKCTQVNSPKGLQMQTSAYVYSDVKNFYHPSVPPDGHPDILTYRLVSVKSPDTLSTRERASALFDLQSRSGRGSAMSHANQKQTDNSITFAQFLFPSSVPELLSPLTVFERTDGERGQMAIMSLPDTLELALRSLADSVDGFPSQDNFKRMCYLSGVTITTLGMGDIVPLTNRARFLVSAESLVGMILIGLFLNSLAMESGKNKQASSLKSGGCHSRCRTDVIVTGTNPVTPTEPPQVAMPTTCTGKDDSGRT